MSKFKRFWPDLVYAICFGFCLSPPVNCNPDEFSREGDFIRGGVLLEGGYTGGFTDDGSLVEPLWGAETSVEILLAFNRCVEICSPRISEKLFKGRRTWFWMIPPSIYGIYWFMFTMPHVFSGIYGSWFFNPFQGYHDDFGQIFRNNVHDFHNYFVITTILTTYIAFSILLLMKTCKLTSSPQQSRTQIMTFIQVALISCTNVAAAAIYVYMQYTTVTKLLIIVGQLCWLFAHGLPPLIYLGLNKTIRKDCIKMLANLKAGFRCCWAKPNLIDHQNQQNPPTLFQHSSRVLPGRTFTVMMQS